MWEALVVVVSVVGGVEESEVVRVTQLHAQSLRMEVLWVLL